MKRPSNPEFVALAILTMAIALRFDDLSLRPFHHDEGVNGFFLTRLVREGIFKYDPTNYHGPTLYYLTLPLVALTGLSDFALRGTTAFFGALTVFTLWRFLAPLGSIFALTAMALFAASPGAVFFSRYFIHESLFVAFTLLALAASPRTGAHERWRFVGLGFFLGLLFATKETAFVSAGAVIAGAILSAWLVQRTSPIALARGIGPYARAHWDKLTHGVLAFVAAAGLLYSSFFRNPAGVLDAFRTFATWTKTAVRDHQNPWYQHISWLHEADPVLIDLGFAGVLLALILRRSFVAVLAAIWAILLFAAYAVVKYKTPWLGLNMLLPLAITGGYLIHEVAKPVFRSGQLRLKPVAILLALLATGFSGWKSLDLETRRYDDETHPYIYAHTQRSFLAFVNLVEERATALGAGTETGIAVFAPENWPLAWYLRDYTKTGYWGEIKNDVDVPLYVSNVAQAPALSLRLGEAYERFGPYHMRGVVELVLFAKKPTP